MILLMNEMTICFREVNNASDLNKTIPCLLDYFRSTFFIWNILLRSDVELFREVYNNKHHSNLNLKNIHLPLPICSLSVISFRELVNVIRFSCRILEEAVIDILKRSRHNRKPLKIHLKINHIFAANVFNFKFLYCFHSFAVMNADYFFL